MRYKSCRKVITIERITLVAIGSHGDTQPLLALGAGFKRAGYDVTFVAHRNLREAAEELRLDFSPINIDPIEVAQSDEGLRWFRSGQNGIENLRGLGAVWKKYCKRVFEDVLDPCRDSNLILFSFLAMGVAYIGEKYEIPSIAAWPNATSICSSMALPAFPAARDRFGGRYINHLHQYLGEFLLHRHFGTLLNDWREELTLSPVGIQGVFAHFRRRRLPVLYGFSPSVVSPTADLPEHILVSGYWNLKEERPWVQSFELQTFLEDTNRPIYVGFGSMVSESPRQTLQIIVGALAQTGTRAIFSTGWSGLSASELKSELPPFVLPVDYVPHSWLFPRVRGAIHHGGASTLGAALHAGIPSIVIPFFGDQFFWGRKVQELGVGPAPLSIDELSQHSLSDSISALSQNPMFASNSANIARMVNNEDGIASAVTFAVQLLEKRHSDRERVNQDKPNPI